ncbi:MAG: hypothetical protein NTX50_12600 [Candidatus Sumerlaeota bacterium]|nr:hypothetical protein [Candidatus Sumerlaeota bacterium]
MKHREYVLAAIRHEQADRVPYTLGFEHETDKELDAWLGSQEWRKKLQCFIRSVGAIDTLGEVPVDDTHRRDVFGSLWRTDRLPWHLERPALKEPRMDGIVWPTIDQFPLKMNEGYEQFLGPDAGEFSLINCGWGLFEQSWRIRGFENMMMDTAAEPEFYEAFLDKLTELRLGMVEKCRDVAADAIMFGDDWGDQRGVIIGPERWRRFLKPRWAKVFEATRAQGKYAICHCCGSIASIMPDIIEIGLDVLESVQPEPAGMDSFELKRKYGDKITFWGCLGSQSTIPFGTPLKIHERVRALCEKMGKGGGFILAPAKSIQPGTPPANSAAVVEAFATQNL